MDIKKISELPIADAPTGAEHILAEEAGYPKRIAVDAFVKTIDPAAFGIPVLVMTGDTTGMDKDNKVTLAYVFGGRSGTLTCKWQGNSSLSFPKKNYTVKFDTAFEAKAGWGEHEKYCLKANWVDASYLRNLLSAAIWGQMVKDRTGADERLKALPNGGAVDGFPIWVTINGEAMGLYTMNIPKDAWMFGMTGENANEGFVCAENTTLSGAAVCDGTDFEIEYAAGDEAALVASLNNLITAVNAVQSADDLPALEALVDIHSVIDYYVHMVFTCNDDGISKNYLLATYDGVKWFMSVYDMDATFGNEAIPTGAGYGWANDWPFFGDGTNAEYPLGINNLLDVVRKYYAAEIKTRFQNARYWLLGENNYMSELYKLAIQIPKTLLDEDFRLWPSRPGTLTNNIEQILNYARVRGLALDWNVQSI